MIAAAPSGFDLNRDVFSNQPVRDALFVVVGLLVFVAFLFAARFAAHIAGQQLLKRQVRADMVVLSRRVVTASQPSASASSRAAAMIIRSRSARSRCRRVWIDMSRL